MWQRWWAGRASLRPLASSLNRWQRPINDEERSIIMGARASSTDKAGTVIKDVTVVNTRDGSLAPGMDIFIENGRIGTIDRSGAIQSAPAAHTINASGKYVVPGFLDMHAHAMATDALPGAGRQQTFQLMIANGI